MTLFSGSIASVGARISYNIALTAGQQYFFELEGAATGAGTLGDPIVRLYSGVTFITENDDGGVGFNARLVYTPVTSGTYRVEVGELGDNATGTYTLNANIDDYRSVFEGTGPAGTLPLGTAGIVGTVNYEGDRDLYSVALVAGTQYYFDLEGAPTGQGTLTDPSLISIYNAAGTAIAFTADEDGGVGTNARQVFTPSVSATYHIGVGALGTATGTYRLFARADDFRSTFEGVGNTGAAPIGTAGVSGTYDFNGDQDLFTVSLVAGTKYVIDLEGTATKLGTMSDPFLRGIYDAAGVLQASSSNDDGGVGNNARVVFTPAADGIYSIAAGGHSSSSVGTYRMLVRPDDFRSTFEGVDAEGSLALGTAGAAGTINYIGDRDFFAVSLVAGTRYFIDLEGAPTGQGTIGDSYLVGIHDGAGTLLAGTTDDDGGTGANSRVVFTPATTGTYHIDAGGWGSWTGSYRLFARADDFRATYDTVGPLGSVAVGPPGVTAAIDYVGDQDLFNVALVAGTQYIVDLEGSATGQGTLADPSLRGIYTGAGALLPGTGDEDGGVGTNARLVFTPATSANYLIAAGGAGAGTYRLQVRADDFRSTHEGNGALGVLPLGAAGAVGNVNYVADRDFFAVDLVAGTQYYIDLEGKATSQGTIGDSYIAGIYDTNGALIANSDDDDSGVGANSREIFTPATSGTHYIAAAGWGSWTGTYRLFARADDFRTTFEGAGTADSLSVGATGAAGNIEDVGDQDLFNVGLVAGTRYVIDLEGAPTKQGTISDAYLRGIYNAAGTLLPSTTDDDGGVGRNARLVFTPSTTGTYSIAAGGLGGNTGTYRLFVQPDDFRSTFEGSDAAGALPVGAAGAAGTINFKGDRDLFAVTLVGGTRYYVDLEGSPTKQGTIGDTYLDGIYDANGTLVANTVDDDAGVGFNSRVVFTPATSGTYFVNAGGWGAWTGSYHVFARPDDYRSTPEGAGALGAVPLGTLGAAGNYDYNGDQDLFTVALTAGTQYIIELEAAATKQGTMSDPFLRGIYNAAGVLQASSTDDDGGVANNARVVFTPAANGTYSIAAGGHPSSTLGSYRMYVRADDFRSTNEGTGPAGAVPLGGAGATGNIELATDRDFFTVSLVAGTSYTIDLEGSPTGQGTIGDAYIAGIHAPNGALIAGTTDDDGGVGSNSRVVFTPTTTGTHAIAAAGWGSWTGTYRIFARADDFRSTYEGNGTAGTGVVGGTSGGNIQYAGDQDVFTASFVANHLYRIELLGLPTGNGTLTDPYLRGVHNPAGTLLENSSNDDFGGSRNSSLDFLAFSSGTYSILAGAYSTNQGTYQLRITDLSGPDLAADITTKGSIAVGATVRGLIESSGERDWFRTTLVGGAAYVIEQISIPGSINPVDDAYLRGIYDAAGVLIPGTSNDDWATGRDSRVVFTPAATGTYYISAGAFSSNTGEYNLSLNTTDITDGTSNTIIGAGALKVGTALNSSIEYARDQDWFAVTLTAGNTYRIRQQGLPSGNGTLADPKIIGIYDSAGAIFGGSGNDDADGSNDSRTTFSPSSNGTYYVAAGGYSDYVGTYRLLVEVDNSATEVPANDSSKATVKIGTPYLGVVDDPKDIDWIGFAATAGTTYQVKVSGLGTGGATLADPVLAGIYAPSDLAVQTSGNDDFGGTKNAQFTFTADTTGTYFIAASAWDKGIGSYQVAVNTASDKVAPTRVFGTPADDSTGVPVWRNISLSFSEAVKAGTGDFVLTGGGKTITIPAGSSQITYTGEVVTINPTADLAPGTSYSLTIDAGAVKDIAGNSYVGIGNSSQFNFTTAAASAADTWTLMVYIAADNNLEGAAIADINEMERVNLPANVNVMVMIDRVAGEDTSNGNWTDTRRGQISFDSKDATNGGTIISTLTSQGELNTGAPATLTSFIDWAAKTAPATNYGLILWDHGGGIAGSAWDDSSGGANLSVLETRQAIDASTVSKFAMIGFDECLMAITEQTMDLRNHASIIVSSQELEPGDGWEYDKFLAPLASNPGMSPMDLGANIVRTYGERYAGEADTTLSAVWTSGLSSLDAALDAFCTEALAATTTAADWTAMRTAAARAHHFGAPDTVDLRDFMNEVVGRALSPTLKTAAGNVATAVGNAVIASTGTVPDAAGMSIYLPYGNTVIDASYTPANFDFLNQVPNWDNFLQQL